MSARVTAETITDAQIEQLSASLPSGHPDVLVTWHACDVSDGLRRYRARARCAEILNERLAKGSS